MVFCLLGVDTQLIKKNWNKRESRMRERVQLSITICGLLSIRDFGLFMGPKMCKTCHCQGKNTQIRVLRNGTY